MTKRISYGAVMIAVMVGLLGLDWWLTRDVYDPIQACWQAGPGAATAIRAIPLAALVALLVVAAFGEMKGLCAASGVAILPASGLVGSLLLASGPFLGQLLPAMGPTQLTALYLKDHPAQQALLGVALVVMLIFAEQMFRRTTADALRRIACTMLTVFYLGIGGALIMTIRIQFSLPVLLLFLVAVKFTDIGAYFTGSAIGRHKLIPWLSPGKTWEGLAGGLALGACASALVSWALNVHLTATRLGDEYLPEVLSLPKAAIFGALVGAAGQFGDLCESLLKRAAGVKDSGHFLPEFGGVLDILDSPLLSAPAAFWLLVVLA